MYDKPQEFKQANPHDQQIAVVAALEGHVSNLSDGVINRDQFILKTDRLIQLLYSLAKTQPDKWPE